LTASQACSNMYAAGLDPEIQPGEAFTASRPERVLLGGATGFLGSYSPSYSDTRVGVDIERVRADLGLEEIAACCFSPREMATLHSLRNDLREQAFFACWTRKEALAKAKGSRAPFAAAKLPWPQGSLR
jgi:4'-phosphopantetheinyl transferase superfamily